MGQPVYVTMAGVLIGPPVFGVPRVAGELVQKVVVGVLPPMTVWVLLTGGIHHQPKREHE